MTYQGIIHRYRQYLDLPLHTRTISLCEGNTPLIPMPRLMANLGCELFIKFEGLNPSGSFKDRGMTVAISEAVGAGARSVICASTGNTAASAAAYAARAGIRAIVLIPEGKVAVGKLAGAIAYGAEVIQIQGSFDQALSLVVDISSKMPIALVNSINPFRIEGQKTAAFEIFDDLKACPDWLCLPVGNAGNITSYWAGIKQYERGLPRILGVQAKGAAPLVIGRAIENPETIATAIRIGKPARAKQALEAAYESKGRIIAVTDREILEAQMILASEGLWVEPASAAGLAGLIAQVNEGAIQLQSRKVVVVCTGHGMKDPSIITDSFKSPKVIPAEYEALREMISE